MRAMRNQLTKRTVSPLSAAQPCLHRNRTIAFTLVEVVTAIAIMCLVFGGILTGYVQSAKRAEWSGLSLAAQAYGIQQLEQARAALWDVSSTPPVNELTNISANNNFIGWAYASGRYEGYTWTNIDIPYSGTNYLRATNFVILTTNVPVYTSGGTVSVQSVQVNTVWRHHGKNFTNSLVNYYAPDQ